MSMQEIVQSEKERVQNALNVVTTPGATMILILPEGGSHEFAVDGFVVLRALPQVDAVGDVKQWRYDLLFREVGYDQGMQYSHLISKATLRQQHQHCAELLDEHGNRYVANVIEPAVSPEETKMFTKWRAYQAADRERFARIDRQLLDEYTAMAEGGDA